jgi:excisionase family DNA binding protein
MKINNDLVMLTPPKVIEMLDALGRGNSMEPFRKGYLEKTPALGRDVVSMLRRIEIKLKQLACGSRVKLEYFSIRHAAKITGLSESYIRRAIRSGELPASNVGTWRRPAWRIARTELAQWMERKKGGTVSVAPRSSLGELIDRHLPGLRGRKDSATR